MLYRIGIIFVFVLSCLTQTAEANDYQYSFYANPGADGTTAPDHSLDILYTVTLDTSKISAFNLSTINKTSTWLDGGVTLLMSYAGKTVSLNSAFLPNSTTLTMTGGFIELFSDKDDFLDVDFNPGAPFVVSNGLPSTPFVFGQLDVYNAQTSFDDFYQLWTTGNTAKLAGYEIAAVPEPTGTSMLLAGLGAIGCLAYRKHKQKERASE